MNKLMTMITGTLLTVSSTFAFAADKLDLTLAGSSTIIPIMESLEPILKDSGIEVAIQGGGSSAGIKAVRDGMADIAMVSRSLTPSELKKYGHFSFAGDLIVIIAHQSNALNNVDKQMVHAIYSGKQATWDNGKNITVIGKENGRATQVVFEQHFGLFGAVTPKAVIIGANGQAIASVENDPNAIAYVSYSSAIAAQEAGSAIKILALNGIAPSTEAAKSGQYTLTRELNLVYNPAKPEAINRIKAVLKLASADAVMNAHRVINYGNL